MMNSLTHLHIISLNVPLPADYGGVIDIYYRLRALASLGVKVHLHCFLYNRPAAPELENICFSVNYYKRQTGFLSFLSAEPYIVKSRRSDDLLANLLLDDYPILFEGLHCSALLSHPSLANRLKVVRAHNCEHEYYAGLCHSESNIFRKFFFFTESRKLRRFEKVLHSVDAILAISSVENDYFHSRYGHSVWIPPFHPDDEVTSMPGRGDYVLFHGDLSLPSNVKPALFVIGALANSGVKVVIAGRSPMPKLISAASALSNVNIVAGPSDTEMDSLVRNAQVIVLPAFQTSGVKLKLISSLCKGRHILANDVMLQGTGLQHLAHVYHSADEMRSICLDLMNRDFTSEDVLQRTSVLQAYGNVANARKIIDVICSCSVSQGHQ